MQPIANVDHGRVGCEEVTREQTVKTPAMGKATNEGEVDDAVMMPVDYGRIGLIMTEESADWPLSIGESRGCARNNESTSKPVGDAAVDAEVAVDAAEDAAVEVKTADDDAVEAAGEDCAVGDDVAETDAIDGAVDAAAAEATVEDGAAEEDAVEANTTNDDAAEAEDMVVAAVDVALQ